MFRGTFEHAIDGKGRTSLPAKFRETLNVKYGGEGQLVLAMSPDNQPCLRAYPMQEWTAAEQALAAKSSFDPRVLNLVRFFVGGALEVPVDKLGRLLVPQGLREHAGLTKDVSFVGSLKFIEIWDTERFRQWRQEQAASGAMAVALGDLGL